MPPESEKAPYLPSDRPEEIMAGMSQDQKIRFAQFVNANPEWAKKMSQGELVSLFMAQENANEAGEAEK